MIRLKNGDVGRLCQIGFDDCGSITGIIVRINDDDLKVFIPAFRNQHALQNVESDQILSLGQHINLKGQI